MGIRTATHQKISPAKLRRDRLADQGRGLPSRLELVVVPSLGPIESELVGSCDQPLKGQAVAGGMGQKHQCTRAASSCQYSLGLEPLPDYGPSL